jgi:hypothetical protein
MSHFTVAPAALGGAAAGLHQVAGGLQELAPRAGAIARGGLSGATGDALGTFASGWNGHLSRLGGTVHELGSCTSAASALYEHTDATVMPQR